MGKSKRDRPDRYVAITHWMMRTAAWRSLDTVARCAYIELSSRYGGPGSNNGRLPCSVREIAEALHVGKATALRALQKLQEHGFVVLMKRGAFNFKVRHATEWRLTEFGCDVTKQLATKEYARWSLEKNTVPPQHPNGFSDGTARVLRRTAVEAKKPSTVPPQHPSDENTVPPQVH
jgi:DNA-binding transcriptional MocR family regulator